MTNCTYCMTSEHIVYYFKLWQNLYRYSNQGWEYYNYQHCYIYCHMAQKGGSAGTHSKASSKMKPIGLWFCVVYIGLQRVSMLACLN
jgi:hypothetical protein